MYGNRLRELRKEKNLTIDEMAAQLEFTRSTYAGYERKFRKPPLDAITKIAKFHDVSTDYLLGLTEEREPKKVEYNMKEYLKKGNLNWGGVPLNEEELKPIRELLEIVVRDRLPEKKKDLVS